VKSSVLFSLLSPVVLIMVYCFIVNKKTFVVAAAPLVVVRFFCTTIIVSIKIRVRVQAMTNRHAQAGGVLEQS